MFVRRPASFNPANYATYDPTRRRLADSGIAIGSGGGGGGTVINQISVGFDGNSGPPATGTRVFVRVKAAGTISSVTMLGLDSTGAPTTGSAVVAVKKSSYSGWPTTSLISASAPPTISSAQKSTDSTLTGWSKSVAAGDILEFNLTSVTAFVKIQLFLAITES